MTLVRQYVTPVVLGALGGSLAGWAVWQLAEAAIDKKFAEAGHELLDQIAPGLRQEIRSTVDREIPPRVRAEMEQKFREVGLTPETGYRISRILEAADRIGLIGVGHAYLAGV